MSLLLYVLVVKWLEVQLASPRVWGSNLHLVVASDLVLFLPLQCIVVLCLCCKVENHAIKAFLCIQNPLPHVHLLLSLYIVHSGSIERLVYEKKIVQEMAPLGI